MIDNRVARLARVVCALLLLSACAGASASPTVTLPLATATNPAPAVVEPPRVTSQEPAPFEAPLLVGCPTDHSATADVLPSSDLELYLEYGLSEDSYSSATEPVLCPAGAPARIDLGNLPAASTIHYRLRYRRPGETVFLAGQTGSFATQRAPVDTFVFAVQSDSHPERVKNQFAPELYELSLANMARSRPDLVFSLGDDMSVDSLSTVNVDTVRALYVQQRRWLGSVGAPLYLVNGNHEQAALANLDGTANNVAVWAQTARNSLFPLPAPDVFYSGDPTPVEHIGLLRDYYAFTWGDALFVVIDPYWHSPEPVDNAYGASRDSKAKRDLWNITLGEEQYRWLSQTLAASTARFKFVFAHHVNGTGRGGVELAGLYEWGGHSPGGAFEFDTRRPGWESPIHQLFAQTGVTIFFQGHDHIFARQELDGVIYQTLPEPANPFYSWENADSYRSGDRLPNSGNLRVTVSPDQVLVEYIRAVLPQDESPGNLNGSVAISYTVGSGQALPAAFPGTILLGRPEDRSIAANLLANTDVSVSVRYALASGGSLSQTEVLALAANVPLTLDLKDLEPNSEYAYQLLWRSGAAGGLTSGPSGQFHTARPAGSSFTFTVDADPHNRDAAFNGALYQTALRNIVAERPDFHVDLGDTFMTEKLRPVSNDQVVQSLLDMRPYLGVLGPSVPLFWVSGNHDGELGWLRDGTANNVAVWSTLARQALYPSPRSGGFYSGSSTPEPFIGLRDGYYSWQWGDALCVVLDPYWYTPAKPRPGEGGWAWTLGREQYDWLARTLAESSATWRFVFIHHLVGGTNDSLGIGRGGIEWAPYYEWGGQNQDGTWGWDEQRPGWDMPIHQLLVQNHVTIVFHGHDHLYVRQELDGVIYQEVPQASNAGYDRTSSAADYGYTHGTILGGAGHLRVQVSPGSVTVDYVRAYLPADERPGRVNGSIADSYTVGGRVFLPGVRRDTPEVTARLVTASR